MLKANISNTRGKNPTQKKKNTHTHKTHVAIVATSSCIITEQLNSEDESRNSTIIYKNILQFHFYECINFYVFYVCIHFYECILSLTVVSDSVTPQSSPPGSSVLGILQARILGEQPFPGPGDIPDRAIEPMSLMSPALADGFFTSKHHQI